MTLAVHARFCGACCQLPVISLSTRVKVAQQRLQAMCTHCAGKDEKEVRKDVGRNRYFTPAQAIEYGIIDRIVRPQEEVRLSASACKCVCARTSFWLHHAWRSTALERA